MILKGKPQYSSFSQYTRNKPLSEKDCLLLS